MRSNANVTRQRKVERPARKPFAATWWLNPGGYELASGLLPTNRALVWDRTPNGRLYPQVIEADDFELASWVSEDLEGDDHFRKLDWIVAKEYRPFEKLSEWTDERFENGISEYQPLKSAGLHREFAALETNADDVMRFVKANGLLGEDTRELSGGDLPQWGESLVDWLAHIEALRTLVALWDLYRDPQTLWEDFYRIVILDCDVVNLSDTCKDSLQFGHPLLYGEYYFPRHEIALAEDESLTRHVARVFLKGVVSSVLHANTRPEIDLLPGSQVQLVPTTLLGAIYVLFMQEIMGRTDAPVRCAACGRWFIPRKRSRSYCDNACKQKAYRANKEKANA